MSVCAIQDTTDQSFGSLKAYRFSVAAPAG
jgi:hypothetical protein